MRPCLIYAAVVSLLLPWGINIADAQYGHAPDPRYDRWFGYRPNYDYDYRSDYRYGYGRQPDYSYGQAEGISGYWTGYWRNSNGSSDYDSLRVTESPSGRISGVWGKGYRIYGQRTAPNTYQWEAMSEGSHYRAQARVFGPRMQINYSVTYPDDRHVERYYGRSDLTRAGY
jgi:hypothetical protein